MTTLLIGVVYWLQLTVAEITGEPEKETFTDLETLFLYYGLPAGHDCMTKKNILDVHPSTNSSTGISVHLQYSLDHSPESIPKQG